MSQRKAIVRPLALAVILAVGFALVFGLLVGWLNEIRLGPYARDMVLEQTDVMEDGVPIVRQFVRKRGDYREICRSLEGVEVPVPRDAAFGAALFLPRAREAVEVPLPASRRVIRFWTNWQSEVWFFMYDDQLGGSGYFIGFNYTTKSCIGFIGRDGFRAAPLPPSERFPVDALKFANRGVAYYSPDNWSVNSYRWSRSSDIPPSKINLISGDQLVQVDLHDRSVKTLIDSAELVALGMDEPVRPAKVESEPPRAVTLHIHLAARTPDRVLLFDAAGKQCGSHMILAELRDEDLLCYELGNGAALLQAMLGAAAAGSDPRYAERQEFVWIDASGTVLRRKTVALEDTRNDDQPWLATAVVPAPIAVAVFLFLHYYASAIGTMASARWSFAVIWPALLAVSALSAVLAGICYRRQRRFVQPWTAAWVVFVFLFGPAGLVGYLCHRRWPVLEACPACGRNAPRDRDTCAACGAAFPPPPRTGIEVFA